MQQVEEIAGDLVREVQQGIDESGVRAGIIGELGCSYPLKATEIKVRTQIERREMVRERNWGGKK